MYVAHPIQVCCVFILCIFINDSLLFFLSLAPTPSSYPPLYTLHTSFTLVLFISIHSILTIGYRQSAVHVADDIVREHLLETQTGEVSGYFDWGAFMVLFGLIGCGASLGFLFTAARYERMLQSQEATSLLGNNRGPAVAGSYGANSYGGASQYENQPQVRPQTDQPAQPQPHQQQV